MSRLSTHVLDTASGSPAAGMALLLERLDAQGRATTIVQLRTNADGRTDRPLVTGERLEPGRYRLSFEVAAYYRARGVALPEPPFLDVVRLDFGIADPDGNYHVPLLVSPWSYSTYRGS